MKDIKKISILSIVFITVFLFISSCKTSEPEKIQIACLHGPTAISMLDLMNHHEEYKYNINMYNTPEEIVGRVTKNEVDVAAIPTNLAAILYKKTDSKIKLATIAAFGALSIISRDQIDSLSELQGKSLYLAGKGAVPEYMLLHILKKENISPEDLDLQYISSHSQVASLLLSNKFNTAMLPEPFATEVLYKDPSLKRVIDITQLWKSIEKSEDPPPMGSVIISDKFSKNKSALDKFLERYKKSCSFASENLDKAAEKCDELNIIKKEIALEAIPRCNVEFSSNTKERVKDFLNILYSIDPQSVGGTLPDEGFYL
jgi:NitT/TauT family transport system substrate-binding protein